MDPLKLNRYNEKNMYQYGGGKTKQNITNESNESNEILLKEYRILQKKYEDLEKKYEILKESTKNDS